MSLIRVRWPSSFDPSHSSTRWSRGTLRGTFRRTSLSRTHICQLFAWKRRAIPSALILIALIYCYNRESKALVTTLTISLPDSLKEFIDREVASKGYGNVSEYVRGLLREAQEREASQRLEGLLLEGLASGGEAAVTPEFWRDLRRDAATMLARQKQPRKARSKK